MEQFALTIYPDKMTRERVEETLLHAGRMELVWCLATHFTTEDERYRAVGGRTLNQISLVDGCF